MVINLQSPNERKAVMFTTHSMSKICEGEARTQEGVRLRRLDPATDADIVDDSDADKVASMCCEKMLLTALSWPEGGILFQNDQSKR